jgi:hypothetical protein
LSRATKKYVICPREEGMGAGSYLARPPVAFPDVISYCVGKVSVLLLVDACEYIYEMSLSLVEESLVEAAENNDQAEVPLIRRFLR